MSDGISENREEMIEKLASLEHEQWVYWSQQIAKVENISPDRLTRWKTLWVPYNRLPEDAKEHDRSWARKVVDLITT
jgi:hypothetical protein